MVALDPNFSKLPADDLVAAYHGSQRPEGHTISPAPTNEILDALRALADDPHNAVVAIVSGRRRGELEEWFGGVPGVALAAEHGFYLRPAGAAEGARGRSWGATLRPSRGRTRSC